jgi:hypothetical protein
VRSYWEHVIAEPAVVKIHMRCQKQRMHLLIETRVDVLLNTAYKSGDISYATLYVIRRLTDLWGSPYKYQVANMECSSGVMVLSPSIVSCASSM